MLKLSPMNDQDMKDFLENGTPSTLENLVANIGEGFDNSTTGVLVDKAKEVYATIPDQRATPEQAQENIRAFYEKRPAQIVDPSSPQRKPPLSIADFKASPYFRDGIEWQDGWSEERAKHLAEQYDKRKDREAIIAKGGWASGFVGQMIGSLPDPINFIPIAEGFQAGKLITKMGAAAVEGAVGNVAVSAITRPYYADRGVDSDFADYVNDAFIGAAMGGAFAGVGHGASKLREIRANAKMKERATIGQAADKTTEAVKSGEDINVEEVVPDYKEAVKNMRKLPDLLKTEEVNNVRSQLEGLGYSKAEIDDQITPMVLQAEFFSQYENKTFAEGLADFQAAEMKNGKIVSADGKEFAKAKQLNDMVDSEIQSMKEEVFFAEKGGKKIFNDGEYISTTGEGTYPSWYSELGIKNKEHFDKVISSKKGPIYERIKSLAEDRLMNGYESPTLGRVDPANEFRTLKGEQEAFYQKLTNKDESFKKWFGNSKLVDESGKPQTLYHGTKSDIKAFNKEFLGSSTGKDAAKEAFFFTDDPETAGMYGYIAPSKNKVEYDKLSALYDEKFQAGIPESSKEMKEILNKLNKLSDSISKEPGIGGKLTDSGASIIPVNVKAENPLVFDNFGRKLSPDMIGSVINQAKSKGHDSVIFKNTIDSPSPNAKPSTIVAVFKPENVKSIYNSGKYSLKNPEILFKKNNEVTRGAIQFPNNKALISLMKDADRSTIIHETGHLILKNLQDLADSGNGMAKNDLAIMKKSFGFDPNAKLSGKLYEDFHEKFARGFELYLMEGKAPSQQLAGVFERFKGWLKSIYQRAEALDVNLSDDARAIYAKLLGGEDTPEVSAPTKIEAPEARFKSEEELDAAAEKFSDSINEESLKGISQDDIQSLKDVLGQIKEEESAADEAFTLFQSGKTDDALKLLKEKGGIPKDKMDEIIDAFNNKLISEDEKRLALEKLIEEQKKILAIEAKELKRQAFLSSEARLRVTQTFQDILDAGGSARQGILAQIEGDSSLRGVKGAGNSVDGHYTSLAQSTSSRAYGELRKLDDAIEDLFENDIQFNERVAKEIITPGSTGDNTARGAAEILSRYEDELRQRANLAGANIGKLEGHIARTHDTDKMLGKRPEWIAFMRENLDLDKSFKGLNGMELESALSDTFDKLTTGEFDGLPKTNPDEPLFKSPRNIAKKMGEARSLHFKSAEAEVAYLKEFGQGNNILETFFGQYERTAKKIALMEKFGPNPESTITHMVEKIRKDIRDGKLLSELDDHAKDKVLKELGTAQDIQSRTSDIGEALMHALGETDTREGWFKNASRIFRSINTMSKLGSAVLSQPTDFVHAMNEKRLMTDNNLLSGWVEVMSDYLKRYNKDERFQEILEYSGLFVDGINYKNFNRFDADNINNKMARWNDKIFRLSGQNWHVRHAKNGAAVALSRELGNNIGKSWDQMHKGLREMMVQYGSFTKDKWEMLQSVAPLDIDGKPYYHPGMVKDIPDEQFEKVLPKELKIESRPDNSQVNLDGTEKDISGELKSWEEKRAAQIKRERFKLEADLKTFFVEEGRNIAPEPDAKIRRQMSFGTKSGSRSNEAIKLFTQFKTFAFVNWDRSIKGKRMMRDSGDYGGLIHHAAATLVLGYVSTALKDFSKGLVPADPTEGKTWGRAAFQSGGLGIMGDFLQAGISSRSGADAMSSLAGPTFSTIGNFVNLSGKTLRGDILTDGRSLTSDWVDFGRSLAPAPVSSLVWTRAAMDHLVWLQIKESLEPGSISRTKRRLKKEYNQKYLIDPK